MRPTARHCWGGLLVVSLLTIPAFGAFDAGGEVSRSAVVPFMETADAQNQAMQLLVSASTVPAVPTATFPLTWRLEVFGPDALADTPASNVISDEAVVTVQAGQTLWAIAQRHGVTVDELQAANGLSKTLLAIGQQLLIPGRTVSAASALPAPLPVPEPAPVAAVLPSPDRQHALFVGDGETLWDIAQTYDVPVEALVEANALPNSNLIHPGQRLVIPNHVTMTRRLRPAVSLANVFMWPARGRVTSGFGVRRHPVFGTLEMHTGIDIGAPLGTPVVNARAGKVVAAGWEGGYGKLVRVDHGDGLTTTYSHLSQIAVRVGEELAPGAVIGYVGNTGFSTGPHLLFEIRVNGRPLDPLKYL